MSQLFLGKKRASDILAWLFIALFIVTFSILALQKHAAFLSGFDLGVYDQVSWNTQHGNIFFYTATGTPLLHLSNHADPILLLTGLLYFIHAGPETLIILQILAIALAGLPLFYFSRQKLKNDTAALSILAAYLLFPGIEGVTISDFHPPVLAFSFLMFAFYFLETKRAGRFLFFAILAMACKEQVPLQVAFLGLYAIIRHKNWKLGLATLALSLTWFIVVMYWVIPANSVTHEHLFLSYYADFGASPSEIILTALTRPDIVWANLWQPEKLAYLRDIFAPFAFLPLLGLPILAIGIPSFAINLLSNNPAMYTVAPGHYIADVTPWLVWGTVFGLIFSAKIAEKTIKSDKLPKQIVSGLSLILLTVAIVWHTLNGYSPLAKNAPQWEVTAHDKLGAQILQQIPADAPITSHLRLFSHLSNRHIAYVFPFIHEAEYLFFDVTADTSPLHPNDYRGKILALLDAGDFGILDANDGYILLKHGIENNTLPDKFYDFARAKNPAPQYPTSIQFGDSLRLMGYDVLDNPRRAETQVRFYWEVLKPIEDNLRLYPFFMDSEGKIIEDTSLRPMVTQLWYPSKLWKTGEVITSETLPWTLGNDWSVGIGVLRGKNWDDWAQRLPVTDIGGDGNIRRFDANSWVKLGSFNRGKRGAIAPAIIAVFCLKIWRKNLLRPKK